MGLESNTQIPLYHFLATHMSGGQLHNLPQLSSVT